MTIQRRVGFTYFLLALLAFAALGLEVLLAFFIEPLVYGAQMQQWSVLQMILHWLVTCTLWGMVSSVLIQFASQRLDFDFLKRGNRVKPWQWTLIIGIVVASLVLSYRDWNGFKIVMEFHKKGGLKYLFQYIYYVFETVLFMLILIFAQKAFEEWFPIKNIPYGGIIVAITWGSGHFFTKDIGTGILCMLSGLAFGSVYLLLNRDIRKTFPVLLMMFVL